jgi:hypothetical protein
MKIVIKLSMLAHHIEFTNFCEIKRKPGESS